MSETNTTTPRKFTGYTDDEVLALNNDQLDTAIRLEAIDRGIAPPIKLSEALRKSEWQGFEQPTDGITVFQLVLQDQYNRRETGMAFLDEDRAKACLSGCLSLYEKTKNMNRCRTCQYWNKKTGDDVILVNYAANLAPRDWWLARTCDVIRSFPGGIEIGVSGGWDGAIVDYVETDANFGCIFHTERV